MRSHKIVSSHVEVRYEKKNLSTYMYYDKTNEWIAVLFYFLHDQWRYCIRLENLGEETVQLRERHWRIFSLSGTLETVRGRGVVGQVWLHPIPSFLSHEAVSK